MKKFGKIIALILCITASLSAFACGGGKDSSGRDSGKSEIGKRGEKGTL